MKFLIIFYFFFSHSIYAQYKGLVIDNQTRYPLRDVKIEPENSIIIFTNKNGEFELPSDTNKYTISHIGYKTLNSEISKNKFMIIELIPDYKDIHEIAVISKSFNQKLKNESGSISLILPEDFKNEGNQNIADIVNIQPGVYMQNGNYNTNRLVIRGIGSRNPYGTNRIKAYLNDIPITGGDGETVIEDLSVNNIGRIEILKGSSSATYGAGLGGAIRILTKYPEEPGYNINIRSQTGSFGTQNFSIHNSYKKNNLAIITSIDRDYSGGYRENSNYYNNHAFFSGNLFMKKLDMDLLFDYINLKAHIPSSLDEATYKSDPSAAAENWKNINGFEQYDKIISGLSFSYYLFKSVKHKTTFFGGYKNLYESRPFNILKNESGYGGIRSTLKFIFVRSQINLGLEYYIENIHWQTYETNSGIEGNLLDQIRELRSYTNIFTLFKYEVKDKLNADIGLNFNILKYNLIQSNIINYPTDVYTFKPVLSPQIGINYSLNSEINIYGSLSHGFSAPSFEETLLPGGIRNNNLKSEEGWNVDIGIKGDAFKNHIIYDLNYYSIFIKNLIVTKRLSEEIFTGINAGRSIHSGIELYSRLLLLNFIKNSNELILSNSMDLSNNRFIHFIDDSIHYSNRILPGIPKYKITLKVTWKNKHGIETNVSYIKQGFQYLNDSNSLRYNGYQIINTNITYSNKLFNYIGYSLTAGINNIFNEHYASMILVNAPSFNRNAPRYYYPAFPRHYYIRLIIKI